MPNSTKVAQPPSGTVPHTADFKHKPLDHTQRSLRFLRLQPELSSDGLVRCEVEHSTLNNDADHIIYTCLSYVWGQENDDGGPFPILLNNKRYSVFANLHRFLRVAREIYPHDRLFWIDAIWYVYFVLYQSVAATNSPGPVALTKQTPQKRSTRCAKWAGYTQKPPR